MVFYDVILCTSESNGSPIITVAVLVFGNLVSRGEIFFFLKSFQGLSFGTLISGTSKWGEGSVDVRLPDVCVWMGMCGCKGDRGREGHLKKKILKFLLETSLPQSIPISVITYTPYVS